ncbi:hypothetical protein HZS_6275 [Henneguya salminicola]|nr:hypothetical protein HZS_6275 [Henneguya salminicola]
MQMDQHSHRSKAAQLQVAMVMSGIKRRALDTTQISSVILNGALQQTSTAVHAKMPNKDAIRIVIQRRRNNSQAAPPQPLDRASIIIPNAYRIYEVELGQMEEFILWDSGEQGKNQILLFGRQTNSEWSHLIEKLYVDGPFSLALALISKIYVIMASKGAFVLPFLYALLPNKEGRTYRRLFESIKELWPYLNPSYSNQVSELCNPWIPFSSKKICSLSPFSIEDIDVAIEALENEIAQDLTPILNWFGDVYIELNGKNRTNNHVEAAHWRLQAEFWMDHPNI